MKLTDHTYACNSLTNFEYKESMQWTETEIILKLDLENFVKSHHEKLFSVGSSHLEPMCARRWAVAQFLALLVVPWYVKSCYLGQETCIISKHQATTMTIAIILYQMQMPSYSKRYNVHIPSNEREMERNNQKIVLFLGSAWVWQPRKLLRVFLIVVLLYTIYSS